MTDPQHPPAHQSAPQPPPQPAGPPQQYAATPPYPAAPATAPAYETWPTHPYAASRQRRVPRWIMMVGVATAVASVVTFVSVLVWPSGGHEVAGPLSFHGFAQVGRVEFTERSRTTLTAVAGDQGYAAWEQGGDLHVAAFDVRTGDTRWREAVTGSARWEQMVATEQALLVFGYAADRSEPRPLFAVSPDTGSTLWQEEIRGDDRLVVTDGSLGWLDRAREQLRLLDWRSGTELWSVAADAGADVTGMVTPPVLARPTRSTGINVSPGGDSDQFVLVTSDRELRLIDAAEGGVLLERANVADPSEDLLLAYEQRLFVAREDSGYRLESHNLADAGEPAEVIHTVGDPERQVEALVACGEGRVCLLDTVQFDSSAVAAVAVDVSGGEVWRTGVPGGQWAIPVGSWLVVNGEVDGAPSVTVLGEDGAPRADPQPGLGVRLNDGNLLLLFGDPDSSSGEVDAAGFAVGADGPAEVGRLPAADVGGCSWNDRYVVCAGEDEAEIWRFAEEE